MWYSIFKLLPANSQTVWIRIYSYFDDPIQATFDLHKQEFISVDTGIVVPAYLVSRWRSL